MMEEVVLATETTISPHPACPPPPSYGDAVQDPPAYSEVCTETVCSGRPTRRCAYIATVFLGVTATCVLMILVLVAAISTKVD